MWAIDLWNGINIFNCLTSCMPLFINFLTLAFNFCLFAAGEWQIYLSNRAKGNRYRLWYRPILSTCSHFKSYQRQPRLIYEIGPGAIEQSSNRAKCQGISNFNTRLPKENWVAPTVDYMPHNYILSRVANDIFLIKRNVG